MWATSPCESPSRSGFRTRPASARRTGSCDNGRGAEHGQDSQPTSVTRAPTCSARSARRAAPAPPWRCPQAMQLHLDEIARTVKRGAHAVLLLDRAGWHTSGALAIPQNMTLILLPARAPELNPVENIWQYLRQTRLSNRVSTPTRRSLRLPARLGAGSSPNPTPSPQSAHGNGPPPVKDEGRWYKSAHVSHLGAIKGRRVSRSGAPGRDGTRNAGIRPRNPRGSRTADDGRSRPRMRSGGGRRSRPDKRPDVQSRAEADRRRSYRRSASRSTAGVGRTRSDKRRGGRNRAGACNRRSGSKQAGDRSRVADNNRPVG